MNARQAQGLEDVAKDGPEATILKLPNVGLTQRERVGTRQPVRTEQRLATAFEWAPGERVEKYGWLGGCEG